MNFVPEPKPPGMGGWARAAVGGMAGLLLLAGALLLALGFRTSDAAQVAGVLLLLSGADLATAWRSRRPPIDGPRLDLNG